MKTREPLAVKHGSKPTGRNPQARSRHFLLMPSLAVLVAFFLLPLALMIGLTLFSQNPLGGSLSFVGLSNYIRILTDDFYLRNVLWLTLKLAVLSTAAAVVLGMPLAYSIARASRGVGALLWIVLMPLWVNVVVRLLGWMILLADRGPINLFMMKISIVDGPVRLLFNELGVFVGLTQITVPFVVLPLVGVIRQIPFELEQVAWSLGAGRSYTFFRITLPLSLPGIAAGSLLAFALNATSFVIPSLLGGGRVRMAALMAYEHAMVYGNLPIAGTLGVVLCLMTIVAVYGYAKVLSKVGPQLSIV